MHNHGLQVLCATLTSNMNSVYSVTAKFHQTHYCLYQYATMLHIAKLLQNVHFRRIFIYSKYLVSCCIFVKFHYFPSEPEQDLLREPIFNVPFSHVFLQE